MYHLWIRQNHLTREIVVVIDLNWWVEKIEFIYKSCFLLKNEIRLWKKSSLYKLKRRLIKFWYLDRLLGFSANGWLLYNKTSLIHLQTVNWKRTKTYEAILQFKEYSKFYLLYERENHFIWDFVIHFVFFDFFCFWDLRFLFFWPTRLRYGWKK